MLYSMFVCCFVRWQPLFYFGCFVAISPYLRSAIADALSPMCYTEVLSSMCYLCAVLSRFLPDFGTPKCLLSPQSLVDFPASLCKHRKTAVLKNIDDRPFREVKNAIQSCDGHVLFQRFTFHLHKLIYKCLFVCSLSLTNGSVCGCPRN